MKEMYSLYIIPFVLLELVYGQVVKVAPDEKKVPMGDKVSVTCRLETTAQSEETKYQWFDNRGAAINNTNYDPSNKLVVSKVGSGLRLLIRDVDDDRAGVYKCQVSVNDQTFDGEFKLDTYAPITFTDCPEEQHAVLGQEGRVNCKVQASEALRNMWTRQGNRLEQDSQYRFDDKGLIILNTSRENAGWYLFMSEPRSTNTLLNPEDKEILLQILEKPIITTPITETTAILNKAATMYCRASGVPTPFYKWFKEDRSNEIVDTDRITVRQNNDQGILEFDPVMRDDGGRYYCVAYVENAGEAETSNVMIVQTPPVIQEMRNHTGSELKSLSITCTAHGDPVPAIQWVKVDDETQYNPGFSADGVTVAGEDINDPNNLGALLRLDFAQLAYTNAGNYKCVATNNAGSADKTINLEVFFPPKFNDQPDGPFYTWRDNDEGFLPCVADANPEPLFTWTKEGQKTTFSVVNTKGPGQNQYTSKLMVFYNGGNDADAIGDFNCHVRNKNGEANMPLTMEKAMKPGVPTVSVEAYSANYIELAMQAMGVRGPDVTHFKAVYVKRGGDGANTPQELWAAKETRKFVDDLPNPRTKLRIDGLTPSTEYSISVYAKNDVGLGDAKEFFASTKPVSVPGPVIIVTPLNSEYSNEILVRWVEPDNGGVVLLYYTVEYRRVTDKNSTMAYGINERWHPLEEFIVATSTVNPGDTQYMLRNLYPGQYYQVQVKALNSIGPSIPESRVIKTKEDPNYQPVAGAPSLVRASVVLTIVATVTACLRNYVLM